MTHNLATHVVAHALADGGPQTASLPWSKVFSKIFEQLKKQLDAANDEPIDTSSLDPFPPSTIDYNAPSSTGTK